MNLHKYTKVIDNFLDDPHAINLLHTFYTDLPKEEKAIFTTALIGNLVIQHQLRISLEETLQQLQLV